MTEAARTPRGSYAKGIAKREEILERGLEVVARAGYGGASIKQLAAAVGLSQAGLLHYFGSKEELFAEILRKRDDVDTARFGDPRTSSRSFAEVRKGYIEAIRHNSEVPGLVQLYSRMAVDAADPAHAAHQYFAERGRSLRASFCTAIAEAQRDGTLPSNVDPDTLSRIVQAVSDGMQLQWMAEPELDMATIVDTLIELLTARAEHP